MPFCATRTGLINQGRYLFPLIPLAGLAAAAGAHVRPGAGEIGRSRRRVGVLASLSLLSIALTASRFYA